LKGPAQDKNEVAPEEILSIPMKAVWEGLTHPGISWSAFRHFNWAQFDNIVMGGGVISKESALLGSYAVLSQDYLNLNMKFGYHFVILDTLCGEEAKGNYILFRFTGGGGSDLGRSLRADFVSGVLERLGFHVKKQGDLVDAQIKEADRKVIQKDLDMVGRLMGATRLMDMYLDAESDVGKFVEDFMNGRYHFASVE
jgi:pyruvate,water dikinase